MRTKKIVSLLLCLAMLFSMLVTTTMGAGSYNVSIETSATEVAVGDTVTVTIKNNAMKVESFVCGFAFDKEKLECVSIVGPDPEYDEFWITKTEGRVKDVLATAASKPNDYFDENKGENVPGANTTGKVGFTWAGTEDVEYVGGIIATATFRAKAAGTAEFEVYEDTGGTDAFKIDLGAAGTIKKSVEIKAPTVPVTGVSFNEGSKNLTLKTGETKQLAWTVTPANASDTSVTFSVTGDAVTVDENGLVKAVKEGTATITIKAGNYSDTCTVKVDCSHANKTPVAEKASDCKNKGWDAYVKCDDCGQLFAEDGTTEIAEIPFRPLDPNGHTGGTATCTAQAVCTRCGQPYGNKLAHSYTAADTKAEALKTAGNCRDVAVYYYSCSVCGEVEGNDNHTFNGEKVATKHVGGTETVNAKAADHKNQTDGYTGDTKCLGCGEIIAYGTSIPAGAHVESLTWTTNGTEHWKVCSVGGCGVEIDGTRATHYSNKAENKATCNAPAKCDACGVEYGQKLNHVPANTWEKDASGHWHECQNGCGEKLDFAAHTPDKQGGATEQYGIFCTECNYEIEKQLAHTHNFNQMNTDDDYLVSAATCSSPAVYKYSCSCGAEGTETFVDPAGTLDPDNHNWDSVWSGADNPDNHWHACLNGCGETSDLTKHEFKMKFDSTKHWEECVCGRKINEGNHIDTDKNYVCDTCGSNMLRPGPSHFGHWDYNGDGRCDYCGAKTGCTHTDANKDGKCDNCSSDMKDIESAKTLDAGVLMYAGMAVLAATGSAAMIGKKRKEQ